MFGSEICLVLMAGLEPARLLRRGILSPLRLPIPPHERHQRRYFITYLEKNQVNIENLSKKNIKLEILSQ